MVKENNSILTKMTWPTLQGKFKQQMHIYQIVGQGS